MLINMSATHAITFQTVGFPLNLSRGLRRDSGQDSGTPYALIMIG